MIPPAEYEQLSAQELPAGAVEQIEHMRSLHPEGKAYMRKMTRRRLSDCLKLLCKPQSEKNRAFLTGYVKFARAALEALR